MAPILVFCSAMLGAAGAGGGQAPPIHPFESPREPVPRKGIDALVLDRLAELGITPARVCSDAVFVRRVYLDVIGTLPNAQEVRSFLRDKAPGKRRALIERLLARDEFAEYWALRWGDALRVKAEFPINLWPDAVQAYHRWIRASIRDNLPYDRFARELLTASGSNFRVPQVNFYRAIQSNDPASIAQAAALTFMGTRIENWTEDRRAGLAAFFAYVGYKSSSEWKEEIVFFDAVTAASDAAAGKLPRAAFPDGAAVELQPERDPREVFADWLLAPGNPWFAPAIVNRVWYWLQGRGIVHEPDDVRPDNPPRHPALLAFLARELEAARYDLKHIYRLILNSQVYQLSPVPRSDHPDAEAYLAFYPLRRMDAEVLIDALCQLSGTTEEYSSPIPEPFTFIPEHYRSIALADGSITSSFLEMFGRPPRDTGLASERSNRPTPAQRLHLLNSSHVQRKIEQSRFLRTLPLSGRNLDDLITPVYLAVLSRFPTEAEITAVRDYARTGPPRRRELAVDLIWALINSPEFLYRH